MAYGCIGSRCRMPSTAMASGDRLNRSGVGMRLILLGAAQLVFQQLVASTLVCVPLSKSRRTRPLRSGRTRTMTVTTDTVRIHADHETTKRLGDWTRATDFAVKARYASVVIDLRSPWIEGDDPIVVHADLDQI